MKRFFLSLLVLICIFIAATGLYANNIWNQPTKAITSSFTVPKGKGLGWVANQLETEGVIPNALIFKLFQRLKYGEAKVKAGEFNLSKVMSQAELIEKLI